MQPHFYPTDISINNDNINDNTNINIKIQNYEFNIDNGQVLNDSAFSEYLFSSIAKYN